MKTLLFIRGISCPLRDTFVPELMKIMNPNVNTVRAIKLSISDIVTDPSDKGQIKAANKDCKNMTRRILMGGHEESFIVIDNENLRPNNWLSYFSLANDLAPETLAWGIDIIPGYKNSEYKNFSTSDLKKFNVQTQNMNTFISSLYKYWRITNFEGIPPALESIIQIIEKGE